MAERARREGGAGPAPAVGPRWRCHHAAERLLTRVAPATGAAAVAIYAPAAGGAARLVGVAGLTEEVAAGWRRLPPLDAFPPVTVLRTGREVWPEGTADSPYRRLGDPETAWPGQAWLPVRDRGQTVAAVGVLWPPGVAPADRSALTSLVAEAATDLAELLGNRPVAASWPDRVQALLDLLPGSIAALEPLLDAAGEVVDWTVVAATPDAVNAAGERGAQLVGGRVFDTYPATANDLVAKTYREVLLTGRSAHIDPYPYRGERPGEQSETVFSVDVHRFAAGLLVAWVLHDDATRAAVRLADTERLGNIGYGTWDLRTGEVTWSDQLYEITGRDRASGPAALAEFMTGVHPEDAAGLDAALRALIERGEPLDATMRYRRGGELRHLRVKAEVVPDSQGTPLKLYGVLQDVTAAKAAEEDRRRLAEVRRELADRQRVLATEHRVVAALQQVILPVPTGPIERPGLRVGVRYAPAESVARVGGDWFDVIPLPGDETLLVVGDVAGHGIGAAGSMAKLRHALAALAVTSPDPGELLGYLNTLIHDDPAMPTVTAVVARYQPARRAITWAQAGHPSPLIIDNAVPTPLGRPAGILLGAIPDTAYEVTTTELGADQTLLLYTDGLVERRRPGGKVRWLDRPLVDPDADLDAMLDALHLANPDDDTCVLAARPVALRPPGNGSYQVPSRRARQGRPSGS